VFLFIALLFTDYSKAMAVFMTNTLWIPVIAHFYLHEKMYKWDIIGIILAFVGMLLIIQPFKADEEGVVKEFSTLSDIVGALCSLFAAFNSATVIIMMRLLSTKIHNSIIAFHYFLGGLIISPVWSFFQ